MNFLRRISKAELEFDGKISAIQNDIRQQMIIPFCDKYNMSFDSGMGGYSFKHPKLGILYIEKDGKSSFPKYNEYLNITTDAMEIVESDYDPEDFSEKERCEIRIGVQILLDPDFKTLADIITIADPCDNRIDIGANIAEYAQGVI